MKARSRQPRTYPALVEERETPVAVLLVDDDPDCRLLVRDAIEDGWASNSILEAPNGHAALELLNQRLHDGQELPGLIYLDVEMPILDGLATLAKIKADPNLRHIPVVMMTGVSDETHMRRAAQLGANSYTLKPANAEDFLQTVRESTNYWFSVHQYPEHKLAQEKCRR